MSRSRLRKLTIIFILIAVFHPLRAQAPEATISYSAKGYLDTALSILERSAYYRDRVNWRRTRDSCFSLAQSASTPAGTYDAVRYAVSCLQDHHSRFRTPDSMRRYAAATVQENPEPKITLLGNGIGYILLPGFGSLGELQGSLYVAKMCARLDSVAHLGVRGWVLDLRKNTGGNMWPMLASVLWFLPEDTLGAFVNRDGSKFFWPRWFGILGSPPLVDPILASMFAKTPLAVLQGDTTASSGEAILVAMKGRPHTQTFGRLTSGRSSANRIYWMPDGAAIVLTIQLFADRFGQIYGESISPDVLINLNSDSKDSDLSTACQWILQNAR